MEKKWNACNNLVFNVQKGTLKDAYSSKGGPPKKKKKTPRKGDWSGRRKIFEPHQKGRKEVIKFQSDLRNDLAIQTGIPCEN